MMIKERLEYYGNMLEKNRLVPVIYNNELISFVTFYIGNSEDERKYVRDDMWSVIDDDINGDTCFVDQAWSNKEIKCNGHQFRICKQFYDYVKNNFKNVKTIRWNRWKNNKVNIYTKEI